MIEWLKCRLVDLGAILVIGYIALSFIGLILWALYLPLFALGVLIGLLH